MVGEVLELPPIGSSDHVCQKWELLVKEAIFKNTTALRPNFKRAKWGEIKDDVRGFSFEPSDPVATMTDKFVAMINNLKKSNIPLCRPQSVKHQLPWMQGARIKKQRVKRWKSWTKFKRTGLPRDYDAYKLEQNKLNDIVREAKQKHERDLIADLKENPNLYFGHSAICKLPEKNCLCSSDVFSHKKWSPHR